MFAYRKLLFIVLLVLPVVLNAQNPREESRGKLMSAMKFVKTDPQKAQTLSLEALNIAKEANDSWAMGLAKSGMGYMNMKARDYKSAFIDYNESLSLLNNADTLDIYNQLDVTHQLAIIYSKFKDHNESIVYYERALELAKFYKNEHPQHMIEKGRESYFVRLPYFLATQYEEKGAHKTAGKILLELWEQAENTQDVVTYARVLNKLGLIKKRNGEFNEAIEYFGKVVSSKEVSKKRKSIAYHNLGETYMDMGNFMKSESFFSIAFGLKEDLDDDRALFITQLYMGELAYKKGELQNAIDTWEGALKGFNKIENEPELYAIYNWLQLAYMDIDIAKAKAFNNEYVSLVDFHNRNRLIQDEEEASERDALSSLIDREKQKRVDAANRQEFIREFWPVFLGMGLLVLFSIILGFRYYMALRANRLLTKGLLKPEEVLNVSLASKKGQD